MNHWSIGDKAIALVKLPHLVPWTCMPVQVVNVDGDKVVVMPDMNQANTESADKFIKAYGKGGIEEVQMWFNGSTGEVYPGCRTLFHTKLALYKHLS